MDIKASLARLSKELQFDLFLSAACFYKLGKSYNACHELVNRDGSRLADNSFALSSARGQAIDRIPLSRLTRFLPRVAKEYIATVEQSLNPGILPSEPSQQSLLEGFLGSKGIILHSQKDNPDNDTGLQKMVKMGAFAMAGPWAIGMGEGLMNQARNAAKAELSQWQMWAVSQPDWDAYVRNMHSVYNEELASWNQKEAARLEWRDSATCRALTAIAQMS